MPLYLIRQDLTLMDCDAIVNPSNPKLMPGGGLDAEIHRAAGPALAKACQALGGCPVGEARITEAYDLPCRWVIHTAGPVWRGGWLGERKKLEKCYRSCFALALSQGCQSLAVPLIGAGSNGMPLTQVLPVALQTLESCLLRADMTVYLVVFSKSAYTLSKRLRADVQSYIDDHYVRTVQPTYERQSVSRNFDAYEQMMPSCEAPKKARGSRVFRDILSDTTIPRQKKEAEQDAFEDDESFEKTLSPFPYTAPAAAEASAPQELDTLRLALELDESFSVKLMRLIDQKGMDDVACYKKANVSRQTWYKILNERDYKPNKRTVLSFAVALELTLEETQKLLESVGFILSGSSLFDVILMYCLTHGIYSVAEIDAILFQYDQETLYSKA